MEAKRPRLQRRQDTKKSMDDLYSKFAARLQKPSEPVEVNSTSPTTGSDLTVSGSSPSTSSGFVNNPVIMNGLKKDAAPAAKENDKASRKCLLCKTNSLPDMVFVSHILGKKHSIMESKQKRTKLQKEEKDRRTVFVSGFPANAVPEMICMLFFNLGMIDFHWASRHAFVEFSTRAEALDALKKCIQYKGKKLSLAPRTQRSHVDDVVQGDPMETLLTPRIKDLIAAPCHSTAELWEVLQQLVSSIELLPHEYEKRQYIRTNVVRCLRSSFNDVTCNIFGSSANNLGFTGADLDLYVSLGYDPYDNPRQADGEAAAASLVSHLTKLFRRERGVSNVVPIPRARVPIVKFRMLNVSVDLSFRNAMPIHNTALINFYTKVDPSVRPYMMFIRCWAKAQNLAGGGKPSSLLTNYALTMLMAFVIMNRRKILPSVSTLRNMPYRTVVVNGWNCGFSKIVPLQYQQSRNYSVFELAQDFFEYYANLDASKWVVCPLLGRLISKQDMTSKALQRLPGLEDYCMVGENIQLDTPLCVQDPFDLTHNITRGLTKIHLERFQLLCRRSSVILQKIVDLQLPLKALFDAIELSDDAYASDVVDQERLQDECTQDESIEPEVIEIDDDTEDSSQEVVILKKVNRSSLSEPEQITIDDDVSSQGTKRLLTDDSGFSDMSTRTSSTSSTASLDQNAFLSQVDLDSPDLYRFQVPSDKIVQLNMSTGALTYKEGQHSAEDVRWSGLNILTFILRHVFAADVISRVTEGESPSKKSKTPDLDTFHSLAILLVTFKHNLLEKRKNVTPSDSSSANSPFTDEKLLTDQLLEDMPKNITQSCTSSSSFTVQFFVNYRSCDAHELLMLANAAILSESAKEQLRLFLPEFRQMTEQCMRRALQYLEQDTSVL